MPQDPLHDGPSGGHGRERRRHPRATLDCPVTVQLQDGPIEARLRDVSRAGLCFYLDRRIPEMTILRMALELPARPGGPKLKIEGSGVVVRCLPIARNVEHYEVAVFLNDMSEDSREELDAYIGALQPH